MFTLDTLRLIKNTYKRFLSLLLIVLIGVAFMMGLMSTPTILRESVDRYYDQQKLHDLQLVSSYGFCEEDIRELKKLDAVKDVFPSKFLDAPVTLANGTEIIARFEEYDRDTDGYELLEGRLPKRRDECVAVYNASFDRSVSIGSVLTLADEASLEIRHFTVVGFAKSPSYMTKIHGSSIYKNQDLGIVLYVPSEVFTSEYYSTVYLTLKDAEEETSFTKRYEDAVEEKKTEIGYFAGEQESYLRDKLVGEYERELKKNEDLFLQEKQDGQQKLDDAKKKLDDAYLELLIGKSQLDTSRATLNASKKEVEANERLLDANEATVNDAIRQVEEQSGQSFDEVYGEIQILYNTYIALEGQKGGDYAETMISRFQKEKADNEAQIVSYQTERDALDPSAENYETEVLRLESEIMILENRNTVLESLIANIESTSGDDNIDALLAEMDAQVEGGVKKNYLDLTMLKDARDQIASGR